MEIFEVECIYNLNRKIVHTFCGYGTSPKEVEGTSPKEEEGITIPKTSDRIKIC